MPDDYAVAGDVAQWHGGGRLQSDDHGERWGAAPYSFGVTAGALPAGMTLTAAGVLAGTPTTAGTSTFTIRGTDANGCFAQLSFTMSITTAVPILPKAFVVLLALGLTASGDFRLRRPTPK